MARRLTPAGLNVILTVFASPSGSLSGGCTFWLAFNPSVGKLDTIDLQSGLTYTIKDVVFSSDPVIAYPGTWLWEAFSACADLGAYGFESNVLFDASTAEYLYDEAILSLAIGGIDFAWHAEQLSDAVFERPEGGWAVRLSGGSGQVRSCRRNRVRC